MMVDELDLEEGHWEIPSDRAKNGEAHIVHLNAHALAAIEEALKRNDGHDYVFLGLKGNTPFSGWGKFKKRLDTLSGVKNWRFHDLRSTFVTSCADRGVDMTAADMCLNHVASSTMSPIMRIYQISEKLAEREAALDQWNVHIDEAMAMASGSNVRELSRG